MSKENNFEKVNVKSYNIKEKANILYRVYKNETEFVELAVSSIQEAIAKSEISEPFKVDVILPKTRLFFNEDELESSDIKEDPKDA